MAGTNVFSIHAASVKAVENYLGDSCPTFTWNGAPIPILAGSAIRRKDLGAGGYQLGADLVFVAVAADVPNPGPALKQTITYMGDAYRIEKIHKLPGGTLIRYECVDAQQAA